MLGEQRNARGDLQRRAGLYHASSGELRRVLVQCGFVFKHVQCSEPVQRSEQAVRERAVQEEPRHCLRLWGGMCINVLPGRRLLQQFMQRSLPSLRQRHLQRRHQRDGSTLYSEHVRFYRAVHNGWLPDCRGRNTVCASILPEQQHTGGRVDLRRRQLRDARHNRLRPGNVQGFSLLAILFQQLGLRGKRLLQQRNLQCEAGKWCGLHQRGRAVQQWQLH